MHRLFASLLQARAFTPAPQYIIRLQRHSMHRVSRMKCMQQIFSIMLSLTENCTARSSFTAGGSTF